MRGLHRRPLTTLRHDLKIGSLDPRRQKTQKNTRTAATLSHAQVRQPINRRSIGRWRNYEWAFDASWDALADEHARRM